MSTKLELLGNLVNKVDVLIIGGGMANTFLFAEGKGVGKSLCEKDLADTARSIVAAAEKAKCRILLPVDATVARSSSLMSTRMSSTSIMCLKRR